MKPSKNTDIPNLKHGHLKTLREEAAIIVDSKLNYPSVYQDWCNRQYQDHIDNHAMQLIALTIVNHIGSPHEDAAHTFVANQLGISKQDIEKARIGVSADPKVQAAMNFVNKILQSDGKVPEPAIHNIRNAGYSEDSVSEIIALCIVKLMF